MRGKRKSNIARFEPTRPHSIEGREK